MTNNNYVWPIRVMSLFPFNLLPNHKSQTKVPIWNIVQFNERYETENSINLI